MKIKLAFIHAEFAPNSVLCGGYLVHCNVDNYSPFVYTGHLVTCFKLQ